VDSSRDTNSSPGEETFAKKWGRKNISFEESRFSSLPFFEEKKKWHFFDGKRRGTRREKRHFHFAVCTIFALFHPSMQHLHECFFALLIATHLRKQRRAHISFAR